MYLKLYRVWNCCFLNIRGDICKPKECSVTRQMSSKDALDSVRGATKLHLEVFICLFYCT